jgi:segregation and condensation protein A
MEPYKVKTNVFEGPLDVLLDLIEKRKLFINDVSLATVTDDYIAYVNSSGVLELPEAAHFVYIASTLLLIKSKSLLPTLTLSEEEVGDIKDLERRLALYKRYKELALELMALYCKQPLSFRTLVLDEKPIFSPGSKLSLSAIRDAVRRVIQELPVTERLPQAIVERVMSLETMIDTLGERIKKSLTLSFKEFSGSGKRAHDRSTRLNVIVSFLALLELVKRGAIGVQQSGHFDDILIEAGSLDIPHYS